MYENNLCDGCKYEEQNPDLNLCNTCIHWVDGFLIPLNYVNKYFDNLIT